jgi:hypothetical protein
MGNDKRAAIKNRLAEKRRNLRDTLDTDIMNQIDNLIKELQPINSMNLSFKKNLEYDLKRMRKTVEYTGITPKIIERLRNIEQKIKKR